MNRFHACIAIILVLGVGLYVAVNQLLDEKKELARASGGIGEIRKCANAYRHMGEPGASMSENLQSYCLTIVTGPNDFDTVGRLD